MRFENGSETAYELLRIVREEFFPELAGCRIKVIFDLKKRLSGGKLVLGSMQKPNEMVRFFTIDDAGSDEGFDYVMRLDEMAWEVMSDNDRIKLVRHELKHTDVDHDANNPYKLRGHTIEDFMSEIRLNEDDPEWAQRVALATASAYEDARG